VETFRPKLFIPLLGRISIIIITMKSLCDDDDDDDDDDDGWDSREFRHSTVEFWAFGPFCYVRLKKNWFYPSNSDFKNFCRIPVTCN
jgi:hypothetical protein